MAREAGNSFQLGWHQLAIGNLHTAAGELEQAETELQAGIALARQLGDPAVELWGCASLSVVALLRGQPGRLHALAESMDRPGRPLGSAGAVLVASFRTLAADPSPDRAAEALAAAAEPLLAGHDPADGARLLLLAAVRLASAGNDPGTRVLLSRCREACAVLSSSLAGACDVLEARLARRAADATAAHGLAHHGLRALAEAGMWVDVPDALGLLGGLAVDTGADAEGLRLLVAADVARAAGAAVDPFAADSARDAAIAGERLGPSATTVRTEGAALDPAAAVAYASRARGERKRPAFGWDSLTPTELAVVRLAATGLTNPAIGEQLFIARGTVKTHLEHVFAKLGVRSRAELAAVVARRGDGP
jgi:DNA-binding CsgD family transcriptional regulator